MLRRQGFTIVELVVSLSIISVLLSLLFPAIQAARQAARVTGCRNNLRQIGLALSNYHDVWQAVPVASLQFGNNGIVNGASYSWPVSLLPQLEQSSLYEKLWGLGTPGAGEIYWKLYQKPLPLIDSQLPVYAPDHEFCWGSVVRLWVLSGWYGLWLDNEKLAARTKDKVC